MRLAAYSGQFKQDIKLAQKRGKDMEKLKQAMRLLIGALQLPREYRGHPLTGDWMGFRDLHIEPDWLLIYRISGNIVRFERTGRHTDLFEE